MARKGLNALYIDIDFKNQQKYKERRNRMKKYKVDTVFIKNCNFKGTAYDKGEKIILDRAEYENLHARGFVAVGKVIKEDKISEE